MAVPPAFTAVVLSPSPMNVSVIAAWEALTRLALHQGEAYARRVSAVRLHR